MTTKAIEPPVSPAGEPTAPHMKKIPQGINFLNGGVSGMMGTSVVQPMDLLKTRMQLLGPAGKNVSAFAVATDIVKNEGYLGFYVGLSSALFRQALYATGRLGVFNGLLDHYKTQYGSPPIFPLKVLMGMTAGAIGAFAGCPTDVALIRMTADGGLPPEKRRNYKHVFDALNRITREEGTATLFSGVGATVGRAVIVNGAQLSSYTQARETLLPFLNEGLPLHLSSGMIAGLVTSVTSLPVDIVKTRVQNSSTGASQLSVLSSIIKQEGVLALWSGFLPTYAKIGPHTVITFLFLEQLNLFHYRFSS